MLNVNFAKRAFFIVVRKELNLTVTTTNDETIQWHRHVNIRMDEKR